MVKKVYFKSKEDLIRHIKRKNPTLYVSSGTSTVVPFDKIEEFYQGENIFLGDLSSLPQNLELTENKTLKITGAVNWKEAKEYLNQLGRDIMTSPTEQLASVLAGIATSATGEHAFGLGTIRDQLISCRMIDGKGEEISLHRENPLVEKFPDYQKIYQQYAGFKNAPFPRFEKEIDLAIGLEGQLGVVVEAEFETIALEEYQYLFITIDRWEKDFGQHLEIIEKVQEFRGDIIACELLDSNSLKYTEESLASNKDIVFLQIKTSSFEHIYIDLIMHLEKVSEDSIFEITESKFQKIRVEIPRKINEENSRNGVIKKGTDVQVKLKEFPKLLERYQAWSGMNVHYNLFGHIGDCHLHFNFLPESSEVKICEKELESFYSFVQKIEGSPFAEHGIGLIKQQFVKPFWPKSTESVFKKLKNTYDPNYIFFPKGFMCQSISET